MLIKVFVLLVLLGFPLLDFAIYPAEGRILANNCAFPLASALNSSALLVAAIFG